MKLTKSTLKRLIREELEGDRGEKPLMPIIAFAQAWCGLPEDVKTQMVKLTNAFEEENPTDAMGEIDPAAFEAAMAALRPSVTDMGGAGQELLDMFVDTNLYMREKEEASSALDALEVFKEFLAVMAKYNTIISRGTNISLGTAFERSRLRNKIVDLDSKFKDSMKSTSNPEAEMNSIVAYIRSLPEKEREDAIMTALSRRWSGFEAINKAFG